MRLADRDGVSVERVLVAFGDAVPVADGVAAGVAVAFGPGWVLGDPLGEGELTGVLDDVQAASNTAAVAATSFDRILTASY